MKYARHHSTNAQLNLAHQPGEGVQDTASTPS